MNNEDSQNLRRLLCRFDDWLSVLSGLSGLLPIHPKTYIKAWRQRAQALEFEKETQEMNKSLNSDDKQSENDEENKSGEAEENKSNTNTEIPS